MSQQQLSRRLSCAATEIQRIYRGHICRRETKKLWKRMNERRKIIEQLVMTEEKYIHDLSIIISDFQMYLFNNKIINSQQVYMLFANVDAIRQLNEQFFVVVHNAFQTYWHYKVLFLEVRKQISFFKIYFQYLNNFTISMGLLKHLKETNGRFKEFLMAIKKNCCYNNLDLEDYLIKPVQRLPKYVLLMKLLLKKTPDYHPDYKNIEKVLSGFQEVNSSNNQKLNKLVNNFKLAELQKQAKLPFHITEPGTQFIMEENVTILNAYNKVQDAVLYLLNNRVILTKKTKQQQTFLQTVNFRYGASLMQNQDQQLYGNCFTLQSIDGDSITFLCQTQKEMIQIVDRIQQQINLVEKKIFDKYSALQNLNNVSQSFIKNITRFDLMPEVLVLGTEQRTDKMLKYTTYIIEVKVKNVRQKIFIRYNELLEAQQLMRIEFPTIEIKQSLLKTTWLLNHKPKTIQERKMRIQRFLTEILSKPEIIQSGGRILGKLGLPEDMYSLPDKIKASESFVNRSRISHSKIQKSEIIETKDRQGIMKKRNRIKDSRSNYRLSIFEDLSDDERKSSRKKSMNESVKGSKRRRLNIESMLYANQLDLGHYTRYSQNTQFAGKKQLTMEILIPWIENSKGIVKRTVQIIQCQRVAVLINKLAKDIQLNYYKDFRLFLQKQYSQMRVLDDDEIMSKVEREMVAGGFHLVFKKMIFIDRESQQHQIKHDRLRLKLIASQVIYDVKKSKYRLNYSKFLTLSVLIGVIQHETKLSLTKQQDHHQLNENNHHQLNENQSKGNKSQKVRSSRSSSQMRGTFRGLDGQIQLNYKQLALSTRWLLANPYSSFFQNDKVWIKDYTQTLRTLYSKLKRIARGNSILLRGSYLSQQQQQIWSGIVELSYISIIDEIKSNQLFGSMGYVVQISEQFREVLIGNLQEKDDGVENGLQVDTKENRNIWLIIKCNTMYLYSINLRAKLYEMSYQDIDRILCYPSSLILLFKDSLLSKLTSLQEKSPLDNPYQEQQEKITQQQQATLIQSHNLQTVPQSIKLKTTTSYSIKELINYYKNFNDLAVKMKQNQLFQQSVLEMVYQNQKMLHSSGHYQSVLIDYDEEECL